MKFIHLLASAAAATMVAAAAHAGTVVDIQGTDDIYNSVAPSTQDGANPPSLDVSGFSAITFSNASGQVYLNLTSGDNLNDPDGIGSAPSSSSNSGANALPG